ncbi:hypothetical protein ATE84_0443 [Aquimarina sp. MAR_2010_214]|uniref:hypothetical protein n=1 Tax=Aquimarina sp. MAR_2010_214 TaxID=1250026 RepID=UPI000C70E1D3|nr:hypothetical protein [Aquimarina sp. MAR_2010_214]PKV48444.1 hypothetical protein ATE84_0443 [Aquimarina sp. MAR_2010_214]
MKKIGVFIVILLATFSCSEELDNHTTQENRIHAKDLEFLGVEHNEGLRDAFTFLKKSKGAKNNFDTKKELQSLEAFLISRTNSNTKYPKKSNQVGVDLVKKMFKNQTSTTKLDSKEKNVSNALSHEEKIYLNKLDEVLKSAKNKDANVYKRIEIIEDEIENNQKLNNNQG